MIMTSEFLFNFTKFFVINCCFFTILLTGISFSTAVNTELVAKSLILGMSFSNSVTLAIQFVFLTSTLVSRMFISSSDLSVLYYVFKINPLVSILFILATTLSYIVFLTAPFYTTSLGSLKLTGTGINLSISNLSNYD